VWTDPSVTDENVAWTRQIFAALEPHIAQRRYLNDLDADDVGDAVQAAYGPNFARLAEVKRRYEPDNLFWMNLNVEPARS